MSLRDALKNPPASKNVSRLDIYLSQMDADDKSATLAALNDLAWSGRKLAAVLTENGWQIGSSAVTDWRRRNGVSDG